MTKNKQKNKNQIVFRESDHSYICNDSRYTSVTQKISEYKYEKDWEKIATNYYKKHTKKGIQPLIEDLAAKWELTPEQIIKKFGTEYSVEKVREIWALKGKMAREGGTNYHNWKEAQDGRYDDAIVVPLINGEKTSLDLRELVKNTEYLELMIYNHKNKLCGQADKIIIGEDSCVVRDYKTVNKDLIPDVPFYWNAKKRKSEQEKFKSPLRLLCNSYWEYALQLSMYGYMLELYGYPPEKLIIDQVYTRWISKKELDKSGNVEVIYKDEDLDRYRIVDKVVEMEVPYLRSDVKKIIR